MNKAFLRLEAAREALDESPARALRLLPPASALPAGFREERDLIAADAWRFRGYFEKAEAFYKCVLRSKSADAAWRVEACLGSAAGLRSVGSVAAARARLAEAAHAAKTARLRGYDEKLALERALVARAAGGYGEAIAVFSKFLRKAEADRDWAAAAYLLWAIGGAERFRGRLKKSQAAFERSLSLARRAGDPVGAGYALFGLGGITRIRGRLGDSARHYAAAERVFRGSEDDFARAYALCGYANALRQLGRLDEAHRFYTRAHKVYSGLGDPADLAYVDWGMGETHLRRGHAAKALPRFKRALAAFTRCREDRGAALSFVSMSRTLHALGRTAEGERCFDAGVKLARKAGLHAHLEIFT